MSFLIGLPFKLFDLLKGPALFALIWRPLVSASTSLTAGEIVEAKRVLGDSTIDYEKVRIAEGRLLTLIFKLNRHRAITIFNFINLPRSGRHVRTNTALVIHELTHVAQFNIVGSVYIPQALWAQKFGKGYEYGTWIQLQSDRATGLRFANYNREQQGKIAQDYYRFVLDPNLPANDDTRLAYEPFIDDLKNGKV